MNVTPLIDVLLVFTIIFMVIVVVQGNKVLTAQRVGLMGEDQ